MSQHPLDRFRPPQAPPELRQRTLAAARAALRQAHPPSPESATWVDRWWQSRALRLAWTAAVCLLLAVNVLITVLPSSSLPEDRTTTVAARSPRGDDPLQLTEVTLPGLTTLHGSSPTWGESWTQLRALEPLFQTQETF